MGSISIKPASWLTATLNYTESQQTVGYVVHFDSIVLTSSASSHAAVTFTVSSFIPWYDSVYTCTDAHIYTTFPKNATSRTYTESEFTESPAEYIYKQSRTSSKTATLQWEFVGEGSLDVVKTTTKAVTIPVLPSYTVSLNANGGSGGTTSLTKWHGEPLDLTTGFTAPTRVGYRFEGWALTSGGAKIDEYDVDEATPLYAVWTPIITGMLLDIHTLRVENGTSTSESDDGTYCYGRVYYEVYGAAAGQLRLQVSTDVSVVQFDSGDDVTISKASGDENALLGTHVFRAHNCDTDTKVTFTVSASMSNTSAPSESPITASKSDILSVAYFPLDILGDNYVSQGQRPGHGLAIGLPCKKEGFAVGMDIFFQQWAGVIQMFAGSTPPAGWLLCDGSAVSRTEYEILYAAIGDTWGAGDGSTTFNLPDLRGRAPIGAGTGSGLTARTLGGTVGEETVTLTGPQSGIQAHSAAVATGWYISTYKGTRSTEIVGAIGGSGFEMSQVKSSEGSWSGQNSISIAAKNATQAHNNMQPSAVVNFIIHTGKVN